jgi:DNA polymerase I
MNQTADPAINETTPRLLLIDISSYFYRAFHAMPDLRAPSGQPTGAIQGVVNMLKRIQADYPSDYSACVFDPRGKTFRDDVYAEYKATRSPMPDDLRAQLAPIRETIEAMGWPCVVVDNYEADDVIGTMAVAATAQGWKTVISTGDKDLAQLVNDNVTLVNTMTYETLDHAGVVAKFGVAPNQIIDYLALIGDTVDNVPGVDKCGPKTAVKWLTQYQSLDGVIAHAADISGVVGQNLRNAITWLETGRFLVTVKCDVPMEQPVTAFKQAPTDVAKLDALFASYGFKSLRVALAKEANKEANKEAAKDSGAVLPATTDEVFKQRDKDVAAVRWSTGSDATTATAPAQAFINTRNYDCITTIEQLNAWIARLMAAPIAALDTETTSLVSMTAKIVGISFACEAGSAAYIPLTHYYPGVGEQLPLQLVLDALKPWLSSPLHKKVGQNCKYDTHIFANHGIAVQGFAHDTLLQSYVLESHERHDMGTLALRHLGTPTISFESIAGKGAAQVRFDEIPIEVAAEYSAEDADVTLQLHHALYPQIMADAGLTMVYETIEMPVTSVLCKIERNGVLIDSALLEKQSGELGYKMLDLENRAYVEAGQPFNLGSPKQLGEILFDKKGIKPIKKTPGGAPSTDEETLEKLAEDHPLPKLILEYRSMAKLKSTYTDKLPRMVNAATGRVHTNYAQAVAVTGRLSSNDPNLQNIPVRTAEGRRIREAFIAPPGSVIVSADYSQIELRIMAHLSEDAGLLAAFGAGLDVHRATASEIFSVPVEDVSSEQRRYAKTINFGLIYGMSAFGLAASLGIDRTAAAQYIERYFARYPGVADYMQRTRAQAHERGYVETVFGRRLWLPDIRSTNQARRTGAERAAINAPMQGTAADLIKLAMTAVQSWLETEKMRTLLIMQVHDELVFEVPEAELEAVKTQVPALMAGVAKLAVPLLAEPGVGKNWDEAH